METGIRAFKETWITHSWNPAKIRADSSFGEGKYKMYMDRTGMKFELILHGRHSRNAIESRNTKIRNIVYQTSRRCDFR